MKTLKRLKKRLTDYRHYRTHGYGIRLAWQLSGVTL